MSSWYNYLVEVDYSNIEFNVYLLNENYTSPEDGTLVDTINKVCPGYDFYTVELNNPLELPKGSSFSVVASVEGHLTTPSGESKPLMVPIEFGYDGLIPENVYSNTNEVIGTRYTYKEAVNQPG